MYYRKQINFFANFPNFCGRGPVIFLSFSNLGTAYFLDSVPSPFFGRVFTCKMGAVLPVFHWKCGCNFLAGFAAVKSRPSDLLAQLSGIHSKSSKNNRNNEDFPLDFRRNRRRIFLRVFSFSNLDSHYSLTGFLAVKMLTFLTRNSAASL